MELAQYYTNHERERIVQEYKNLLKISYQTLTDDDQKLIRKAFDLTVDAHKNQRRKSGEPYIFHPIAVAKIVAEQMGLDATSIACALLHDVVEDTSYTHDDMEKIFGQTIAKIVKGLTKISSISKETNVSLQAENFRKMLLTLNDDIRVILIKIADRLHNMQTLDSMPQHKQEKIASETLFIYAPLAHRIGLFNIKTELEDLALKYTEPKSYTEIYNKIQESKEEQKTYISEFSQTIASYLEAERIDCSIKGRPKSIYSIYKKMKNKEVSYEEVYDKFAIRVVYKSDDRNEKFLAWKIYSIVTDHFRPNPTRLRDWLSSPKSTGYEALHITVMGPQSKWVEVQIRSERMHEIAEKGYAAHFKYKHGEQKEHGIEEWLNKLRDVLENSEGNAVDFVEDFKLNLYSKEIFVFTPNGEIKSLPKGSTALDFAFSIHTGVGMKTRGAKVNNKLVPLNHQLKSGDLVEIITAENAFPTNSWLNYATTSKALTKIKSALRETQKQIADEGKEMLKRKLKQLKITLSEEITNELVNYFKTKTSLEVFYKMATGEITNPMLRAFAESRHTSIFNFNFLKRKTIEFVTPTQPALPHKINDKILFGKDKQPLDYSFSQCCHPIPGDAIFGFVTVSGGIKIHKKNCPNALSMQSNYAYRIMQATWEGYELNYEATLKLTGLDSKGILAKVTTVINSNPYVNITDIHFNSNAGFLLGEITLEVPNNTVLEQIIEQLKHVKGLERVVRE